MMATIKELKDAIRRGEREPFSDADRVETVNDQLEEVEAFHEAEDGELIIRFAPDIVFDDRRPEKEASITDAAETFLHERSDR